MAVKHSSACLVTQQKKITAVFNFLLIMTKVGYAGHTGAPYESNHTGNYSNYLTNEESGTEHVKTQKVSEL